MTTALSKNGVLIRLPDERWIHLTEGHSEMAGYYSEVLETLEDPDAIYEGGSGELLAAKEIQTDKYIVVVYKEISEKDGFVITAFLSSRRKQLERRRMVWPQQK
ncbi:MAG: hypothetical protein LUQ02_04550 [Methanothrix sp.]|nr:hypothetical protein [Methanothrix sp.]